MAYTPLRVTQPSSPKVRLAHRGVPVILDFGDHASVVPVTLSRPPQVGDRFDLDGACWEIVRAGDLLRGYVARRVGLRACVQ